MVDHSAYSSRYADMNSDDDTLPQEDFIQEKTIDDLLIDAVQSYPFLYNHQDKNFKNNMMKDNAWKEIAEVLNRTVDQCMEDWKRLRERFGREKRLRKDEDKSGSGAVRRTPFSLYETMLFLDVHVRHRKSYGNLPNARLPKMVKSSTKTNGTLTESTLDDHLPPSTGCKDLSMSMQVEELEISSDCFVNNTADHGYSSGALHNFQRKRINCSSPIQIPLSERSVTPLSISSDSQGSTQPFRSQSYCSTSVSASPTGCTPPLKRGKPLHPMENSFSELVAIYKKSQQHSTVVQSTVPRHLTLFFQSIAEDMALLPDNEIRQLKMKISNLVYNRNL